MCVRNIWIDVKLAPVDFKMNKFWLHSLSSIVQGGSARPKDAAQRRHCQFVVTWNLTNYVPANNFPHQRPFYFQHGLRTALPIIWCTLVAICIIWNLELKKMPQIRKGSALILVGFLRGIMDTTDWKSELLSQLYSFVKTGLLLLCCACKMHSNFRIR